MRTSFPSRNSITYPASAIPTTMAIIIRILRSFLLKGGRTTGISARLIMAAQPIDLVLGKTSSLHCISILDADTIPLRATISTLDSQIMVIPPADQHDQQQDAHSHRKSACDVRNAH